MGLEQQEQADWGRTQYMNDRKLQDPHYQKAENPDEQAVFQGRPVISRDTPINGGVYLGSGAREAIVVDDNKDLQLYIAYATLVNRHKAKTTLAGKNFKEGILEAVFEKAKECLPYDNNKVENLNRQNGFNGVVKVQLGFYMRNKCGVCRHQALLAAYFLEKLKEEGHLSGTISVDRNTVKGKGGHAWVRYKTSSGKIVVIDPAQGVVAYKDNISADKWPYDRPDEVKKEDVAPQSTPKELGHEEIRGMWWDENGNLVSDQPPENKNGGARRGAAYEVWKDGEFVMGSDN